MGPLCGGEWPDWAAVNAAPRPKPLHRSPQMPLACPALPCPCSSESDSGTQFFRSCFSFYHHAHPSLDLYTLPTPPSLSVVYKSHRRSTDLLPGNGAPQQLGHHDPYRLMNFRLALPLLLHLLISRFIHLFLCRIIITTNLYQRVNAIHRLRVWTLELPSLASNAGSTPSTTWVWCRGKYKLKTRGLILPVENKGRDFPSPSPPFPLGISLSVLFKYVSVILTANEAC